MTSERISGGRDALDPGGELDEGTRSVAVLRAALAAIGWAVTAEALLGAIGVLGAALPVVLAGWLAGAVIWLRAAARRSRRASTATTPNAGAASWNASDVLALAAVGVALASRAWDGLHRDHFTYDVLSYHLHLPATWRATGRLSIVPTPFGDQAPAYAPGNAELLYQLLLSATGNVRLAHVGQAPFAALACLAIFAGGRTLRAGRTVAAGSALAFLLVPEVWQQASGAMTDLAAAAFFLAALPLFVRCSRPAPAPADVLAGALALGLLLGTKYLGAILAIPLLTWALALGARAAGESVRSRGSSPSATARVRPLTVALCPLIVLGTGGFWYVRNAVVTGDPTFPVTLAMPAPFSAGALARGLYGGAAMRAWTYHLPVTDLQPLLEIASEIGWGFLAGAIIGGIALLARRRPGWPALLAISIALAWLVVPYQQSRFFFAAWGIAALMMGVTPRQPALALAIAVGGGALQFPTGARVLAAGVFGLAMLVAALERRHRADAGGRRAGTPTWPWLDVRWRPRPAWALAALAAATTASVGALRAFPRDVVYTVGDHHDAGWDFARQHLHGRRIAYAGSNLPLPLWGWRLDNDVRYVNVKGAPEDRLLERAPRETGDAPATASAEPAPERAAPDRAAWLRNLGHHRIDALFVTALYPAVAEGMPHDAEGFPTERAWADALPAELPLRFAAPGVRIYDVRLKAREGEGRTESR